MVIAEMNEAKRKISNWLTATLLGYWKNVAPNTVSRAISHTLFRVYKMAHLIRIVPYVLGGPAQGRNYADGRKRANQWVWDLAMYWMLSVLRITPPNFLSLTALFHTWSMFFILSTLMPARLVFVTFGMRRLRRIDRMPSVMLLANLLLHVNPRPSNALSSLVDKGSLIWIVGKYQVPNFLPLGYERAWIKRQNKLYMIDFESK